MKKNIQNLATIVIFATMLHISSVHADGWFDSMINSLFGSSQSSKPSYNSSSYSDNSSYSSSSSSSGYSNSYSDYTLTEYHAKSYVDQIAAAIDHAIRPYVNDNSEFQELKTKITRTVLSDQLVYKYTPHGKRYKKDLIDQYINGAILEYIEKESYRYSLVKTNNRTIARKIAKSMFNNALAVITQNGAINLEAITQFVGASLQRAINNELLKYDAPYQTDYTNYDESDYNSAPPAYSYSTVNTPPPAYTPQPTTYSYTTPPPAYSSNNSSSSSSYSTSAEEKNYPSDDCCACFETLDSSNRLFLRPCGHDMCRTCIYEWFFCPNQNKTCPKCRVPVKLELLKRDLAA